MESSIARCADAVMAAIRADVASGIVPADVASFGELHDYVAADDYATEAGVPWGAGPGAGSAGCETVNAVECAVDARIRAGELRTVADDLIARAYRIGSRDAYAGKPMLDLDGDDSARLMNELGQTAPTTVANAPRRSQLCDAYSDGYFTASAALR